mgnify:FL=1
MSIFVRNPYLFNCLRHTKFVVITTSGSPKNGTSLFQNVRFFSVGRRGTRGGTSTRSIPITKDRRSFKEILMQPTTGAPFAFGSSAVAGASLFGIGALCYYGFGLANTPGTLENA